MKILTSCITLQLKLHRQLYHINFGVDFEGVTFATV